MITNQKRSQEGRFDWPLCYDAESCILGKINAFLQRNPFAQSLSDRMIKETGTLFHDWVDHLVLSRDHLDQLRHLGYQEEEAAPKESKAQTAFWHPEAMLPRVVIDQAQPTREVPSSIAIRVDSISDFLKAHGLKGEPEGPKLSRLRRFSLADENETRLLIIERRGYRGYCLETTPDPVLMLKAHDWWRKRPRQFTSDAEGFARTFDILDQIIDLVGRDRACSVVFEEERAYWESRNRAAQIQKARQDKLGLGWANHDHHTFRSSRRHFVDLMRFLERLGFHRRERYYTGAQAGWGAQILEQPVEGVVAFCDVDLQPEETEIDFSREQLPPAPKLGTIGLWVGLHGESLLEAGMHHLECRFDYSLLRNQLADLNVVTMKPFSDLPFLKQAFTEGERWPVRRDRAEKLLKQGLIDQIQFDQFIREGAIGSHLENLQRKGGFKGFNQKSVSVIIEATDPRLQTAHQ